MFVDSSIFFWVNNNIESCPCSQINNKESKTSHYKLSIESLRPKSKHFAVYHIQIQFSYKKDLRQKGKSQCGFTFSKRLHWWTLWRALTEDSGFTCRSVDSILMSDVKEKKATLKKMKKATIKSYWLIIFHDFGFGLLVVEFWDHCVEYLRDGTLYLGSKVRNIAWKPWFSTIECGCKSLAGPFSFFKIIAAKMLPHTFF